jgi:hypothetical protein
MENEFTDMILTWHTRRAILAECEKLREKVTNDDAYQHILEIEVIVNNLQEERG